MARSYSVREVRARDIVPAVLSNKIGWESAVKARAELKKILAKGEVPKNERDDPSSPASLQSAEKNIYNAANEISYVWDKHNRLISISGDGRESTVNVTVFREQMLDGSMTHNHPSPSSCLSIGDIDCHINYGLRSTRAIDRNGNTSELIYNGDVPADKRFILLNKEGVRSVLNEESFNNVFGKTWMRLIQKAALEKPEEFERAGGFKELHDKSLPDEVNPFMRKFVENNGYAEAGIETMKWIADKLRPYGFTYLYNDKPL